MFYLSIVFPMLKLADKLFPKYGYFIQTGIWLSYEYLRTTGFIGYSYGILGYSQYNFTSLIGIADLAGVTAVSLIIILFSAIISRILRDGSGFFKKNFRKYLIPLSIWFLLFFSSIIYSTSAKVDYSESPVWRTALIQHNVDSWRKGLDTITEAVDSLIRLTDESIKENPDIIIWSETAYVPAIEYHLKYRDEREKVKLTQTLLEYIDSLTIPLVLGNNDTVKKRTHSEYYNAILMFEDSTIVNRYRKMHLVPFGEHFPYGDIFPWLDKIIRDSGASRYDKGSEYTIFEHDDIKFGGLICFEDTFGYLSRGFVNRGAQVLVNLTNDSWSLEPLASIQHMGMAVFRTIENRRSMVRSTNGGFTTVIDPNGKRISELDPFTEGYLVENVPIYSDTTTLYSRWGNWLDILTFFLTFSGLISGIIFHLIKNDRKKKLIEK